MSAVEGQPPPSAALFALDAVVAGASDASDAPARPGAWALVQALRAAGMPVAVYASSVGSAAALRSAGLDTWFDAQLHCDVDGSRTGLLQQLADRLDVEPARCLVFDDMTDGIEAAVRGGFGRVVGIATGAGRAALAAAGAAVVVDDLAELRVDAVCGVVVKTLASLPDLRAQTIALAPRLGRPLVFLDYDGTLTPIVDDHRRAVLDDGMRSALSSLARCCPVVIVSGRDLAHLRRLVGLPGLHYAGSHGFEIAGAEGSGVELRVGEAFVAELDRAERALRATLAGIDGHSLERKTMSIAVHYRQVADSQVAALEARVAEVLGAQPRLQGGRGKKVVELRPALDWHKGAAVCWLMAQLDREGGRLPVYVGDDLTDEDAFRVLAGRGLCIAVRHEEDRPTAADYALGDTGDVHWLLGWLAAQVQGSGDTAPDHPRGTTP